MKLLFCPHCYDVRKLGMDPDHVPKDVSALPQELHKFVPNQQGWTRCVCGKSWGRYRDEINAVYGGDAVMLGIANSSLREALDAQRRLGDLQPMPGIPVPGRLFDAFIIPESAPTVRREK